MIEVEAPPVSGSAPEAAACASMFRVNLNDSIAAKRTLLADAALIERFGIAAAAVIAGYRKGGRLYIAGNGGSAADSQHIAAEFISKLARDRDPLPAEALTTDTSILTAIGNDYGFEHVFERQLRAKLRPHDMFLGITTSGASANIWLALKACRAAGATSILFAGRDGGMCAKEADHALIVPGTRTATIQELHIVLGHSLCEAVENAIAT